MKLYQYAGALVPMLWCLGSMTVLLFFPGLVPPVPPGLPVSTLLLMVLSFWFVMRGWKRGRDSGRLRANVTYFVFGLVNFFSLTVVTTLPLALWQISSAWVGKAIPDALAGDLFFAASGGIFAHAAVATVAVGVVLSLELAVRRRRDLGIGTVLG